MKQSEQHIIHIEWEGPKTWGEVLKLKKQRDQGLYQIYGCHPIYGADVLLYIGKTERQNFGKRLNQEKRWQWIQDFGRISIYVGRLASYSNPSHEEWQKQINLAEKLLIVSHEPARNTQKSIKRSDPAIREIRVFNWNCYRSLMPEVSGHRWGDFYDRDFKSYLK